MDAAVVWSGLGPRFRLLVALQARLGGGQHECTVESGASDDGYRSLSAAGFGWRTGGAAGFNAMAAGVRPRESIWRLSRYGSAATLAPVAVEMSAAAADARGLALKETRSRGVLLEPHGRISSPSLSSSGILGLPVC